MMTAKDDAQRKEGVRLYMKSAKALDPSGLNNVAYSYEVGQGAPQSDEAALGWYEMAAIAKSPPARRFCAAAGAGAWRPNPQGPAPEPFELYLLAAKQGDAEPSNGWSRCTIRASWDRRPTPRRPHCGVKSSGWPRCLERA